MTRYIDADVIDYAKYVPDVGYLSEYQRGWNEGVNSVLEEIAEAPTANVVEVTDQSMESLIKGLEILGDTKDRADVVEVVRCKDCRSGCPEIMNDNGMVEVHYYCDDDGFYHSGDYYCADGERKG